MADFLPFTRPSIDEATIAGVAEVLRSGWITTGPNAKAFEAALSEHCGGRPVRAFSSGTITMEIALRLARVGTGDEVITTPLSWVSTANVVLEVGAKPVFVDVDPKTRNIDLSLVEVKKNTRAIIPVDLAGLPVDRDQLYSIAKSKNLRVIEDAAQAFGARWGGRAVGCFGDAGIYSFGVYKNVNAFFGGMLVTPHAELAAKLRAEIEGFPPQELGYFLTKTASGLASDVATWPPLFKGLTYRIFRFGFLNDVALLNNQVTVDMHPEIKRELPESYLRRLTPMQARLILPQLEQVDEHIRARIRAAQRYHEGLRDLPEIVLPPLRTDFSHTYTYFPIQVKDRADFLRYMMREHRDVAAQHLRNCAGLPCFEEFARDCPNARVTANSVALLPTYPRYGAADVDRNIAAVRRYFGKP
jgi:dTDP-4-amino-4,6-dideoxygalactose transaminase